MQDEKRTCGAWLWVVFGFLAAAAATLAALMIIRKKKAGLHFAGCECCCDDEDDYLADLGFDTTGLPKEDELADAEGDWDRDSGAL